MARPTANASNRAERRWTYRYGWQTQRAVPQQAALARHTLAAYPPDLLIDVPRTACRSLEFHRAAEVIEIGHELAAATLDQLHRAETPTLES